MGTSVLMVALVALAGAGQTIRPADKSTQDVAFERWWDAKFEWKFEELPTEGSVEDFRVPYSGHIYPDTAGGTASVLRKYDRAFNRGRTSATSWERWDTTAYKERSPGLFGGGLLGRMQTPYWHGHCNGWTAAAIRHAEPQHSVYRNGVEFTTADIKGLLAEIYIYNDTAMLAGYESTLNAGTFHAILANWIGRGSHPIGMEADPGKEKWNYPIYAYASSFAKRSGNRVEVKTNVAYAKDSDGEYYESPRIKRIKYFHYTLQLNNAGEIVGGSFHRDSSVIDMLWVPLSPKQAGRPGNERGNPHVNVDEVLAIWRESVDEEVRQKWFTIDPAPADRIADNLLAQGSATDANDEPATVSIDDSAPVTVESPRDDAEVEVEVDTTLPAETPVADEANDDELFDVRVEREADAAPADDNQAEVHVVPATTVISIPRVRVEDEAVERSANAAAAQTVGRWRL